MKKKTKTDYSIVNIYLAVLVIFITFVFTMINSNGEKPNSYEYTKCQHKSYKVVTTGMEAFGFDPRDTICNQCLRVINKPKKLWYEK